LADVDPAIANIIAYNLADSIDTVAMNTLGAGSNVLYGGSRTSTATLTASDTIDSADIRKAVAKLRSNKAKARRGSYYWCGIHPEVSHDLRAESGNLGWNFVHAQTPGNVDKIWAGEIGDYEGAFFVESSRLANFKSGADQTALATTTATVAGTSAGFTIGVASSSVIASRAEVGDKIAATGIASTAKISAISTSGSTTTITVDVAEEPHIVIGNVTDKLMRFRPMGWYGVLGFSIYRDEALYRIETGSSIAAK
jgi:N4-gp56 family major capsid protein